MRRSARTPLARRQRGLDCRRETARKPAKKPARERLTPPPRLHPREQIIEQCHLHRLHKVSMKTRFTGALAVACMTETRHRRIHRVGQFTGMSRSTAMVA